MPTPSISGLSITFPAACVFSTGSRLSRTVVPIQPGTVTLDACASGTESKTINWKQGVVGAAFVNCPTLSYVQRTAISGASAVVNGSAVAAGNVKVHARGMIYTDIAVADPLQMATVTYSYKRERYDLIECDVAGAIYVVKGQEVDFAASDFMPGGTAGRFPLFYAYVWNDTVELIDASKWTGTTPRSSLASGRIAAIRAYNQARLPNLLAALAAGGATIAAYGDSITAIGGGWAATGGADDTTYMATQANGSARDTSSFVYFHDAAMRSKYAELGAAWPQVSSQAIAWGRAKKIAAALTAKGKSITLANWGIGGTNCGTGVTGANAPNGSNPTRLSAFNGTTFNAVIVNFMMNDFVGFATTDLYAALTALVTSIKGAHPSSDIILAGCPGINTENPNDVEWWRRANRIHRQVARAQGCAFIPTDMFAHDDPGYLKISRHHYSAGNRYNHQTPWELAQWAAIDLLCLGLD